MFIFFSMLLFQDGQLNATSTVSVKVVDVQNRPPEFLGAMSSIVSEDAPVVSASVNTQNPKVATPIKLESLLKTCP